MEITILLILVLFSILLSKSHPMFGNAFLLLAGLLSITGITTNQITNITSGAITYATIDPWITWAISLTFTAMAVINYIDLIDDKKRVKDAEY
jgi:hypothetical protein